MNDQRIHPTQRGFISFPTMCTVALLGLIVIIGLKVGPVYLDHQTLSSVVNSVLAEASEGKRPSKKTVRKMINNRLMTNRIEFLKQTDMVIERGKSTMSVVLDYERRVPVMFNVDLVAKFNTQKFETTIKE